MSQLSHAYGPGDINCVAIVPGAALHINEATDASYSEHVDKVPIRRLGHRTPVGFAQGAGTFAGTIVCWQLTKGAFWRVRNYFGAARVYGQEVFKRDSSEVLVESGTDFFASAVSVTQLPPFHLMWVHTSEEGQMSIQRWYGVTFSDKGGTFGKSQKTSEQTLQYQCTYQEELRLHRSLTVHEMEHLKNRVTGKNRTSISNSVSGFYPGYYQEETLVESLSAVSDNLADEYQIDEVSGGVSGLDGGDLRNYLLGETQEYAQRVQEGEATSLGVFDTGDVVFRTEKPTGSTGGEANDNEGDGSTEEETVKQDAATSEEQVSPDAEFEATASESIPLTESNTSSLEFREVTQPLRVEDQKLFIGSSEEPEDVSSGQTTLQTQDYYRTLGVDQEENVYGTAAPQSVTIVVDEAQAKITRTADNPAPIPLSLSSDFDPTGTYTLAWESGGFEDEIRIEENGSGQLVASGSIGPQAFGPALAVPSGNSGLQFPIERGVITVGSTDERRLFIRRQGGPAVVHSGNQLDVKSREDPSTNETYYHMSGALEELGPDWQVDIRYYPSGSADVVVTDPKGATYSKAVASGFPPAGEVVEIQPRGLGAAIEWNVPHNETSSVVAGSRTESSDGLTTYRDDSTFWSSSKPANTRLTGPSIDLTRSADGVVQGTVFGHEISGAQDALAPGVEVKVEGDMLHIEYPERTFS